MEYPQASGPYSVPGYGPPDVPPFNSPPLTFPTPGSSHESSFFATGDRNSFQSYSPSPSPFPSGHSNYSPSGSGTASPLIPPAQMPFQDQPSTHGFKRTRVGSFPRLPSGRSLSGRSSVSDFHAGGTINWNDERQSLFEGKLIRLTASADLSFSWVENPEWLAFLREFLPQAKSPSRKVLSQRLLPQTLKVLRVDAQKRANGIKATVQCDGWTGENAHHFVAFMMTGEGQVSLNLILVELTTD